MDSYSKLIQNGQQLPIAASRMEERLAEVINAWWAKISHLVFFTHGNQKLASLSTERLKLCQHRSTGISSPALRVQPGPTVVRVLPKRDHTLDTQPDDRRKRILWHNSIIRFCQSKSIYPAAKLMMVTMTTSVPLLWKFPNLAPTDWLWWQSLSVVRCFGLLRRGEGCVFCRGASNAPAHVHRRSIWSMRTDFDYISRLMTVMRCGSFLVRKLAAFGLLHYYDVLSLQALSMVLCCIGLASVSVG